MVADDQPHKALSALRIFVPADPVASRGVPLSWARAGMKAKGGKFNRSRMRAATSTRQAVAGADANRRRLSTKAAPADAAAGDSSDPDTGEILPG